MHAGDLAKSLILLASGVALGGMLAEVAKAGGFRGVDEPKGGRPSRLDDAVSGLALLGFAGLSMHAFGRWVLYYAETGQVLSMEALTAPYE